MAFDFAARIEDWRAQLLSTSKRNRLISFKSGRTGGVTLVRPDPAGLWSRLLAGNTALTFVWKRDLIDLPPDGAEEVADDALILFEPGEATEPADEDILEQCLRSPRLRPNHILTDQSDRLLAARLTRLSLNA